MRRTFSSEELCNACVKLGWQFDRQSGSHMAFVKPGQPRPIIIPAGRKVVAAFVVSKILNQLGCTKDSLVELLIR